MLRSIRRVLLGGLLLFACAAGASSCSSNSEDTSDDLGIGDDSSEIRSSEVVRGYKLPFAAGRTLSIVQFPHAYRDQIWNAVDIGLPRGSEVLAMKSGTVSAVVDESDDYRAGYVCNWASCNNATNFVIIQHEDGQESSYLHIAKGSAKAAGMLPGKKVCQGQAIGKIGHNGFSYGPHVHVSVQGGGSRGDRNQAWGAMWSKPTKVIGFVEAPSLTQGRSYTSTNRPTCAEAQGVAGASSGDAGARDASSAPADAGTTAAKDAGKPPKDAGAASVPEPDAGELPPDDLVSSDDLVAPESQSHNGDGPPSKSIAEQDAIPSSGCSTSRSLTDVPPELALALLLLAVARRRRLAAR
jgi:uncharacterized protein (TIGR03382 family)